MDLPGISQGIRFRWTQLQYAQEKIKEWPETGHNVGRLERVWPTVKERIQEFCECNRAEAHLTRVQERSLVWALSGGVEKPEWNLIQTGLGLESLKETQQAAVDLFLAGGSGNGRRLRNLFELFPRHRVLGQHLAEAFGGKWAHLNPWPDGVITGLRNGVGLAVLARHVVESGVPLTLLPEKLDVFRGSKLHLELQKTSLAAATWNWLEPQVEELLSEVGAFDSDTMNLFFSIVLSELAGMRLPLSRLSPAPGPFELALRKVVSKFGDPRKNPGRWRGLSDQAVAEAKRWMSAGDFRTALWDFRGDPDRKNFWKRYADHVMDCRYFPARDVQGHTTSAICIVIGKTVFTEFGAIGNAMYYWRQSEEDIWKLPVNPSISTLKPDRRRSFAHRGDWQPKLRNLIFNRTGVAAATKAPLLQRPESRPYSVSQRSAEIVFNAVSPQEPSAAKSQNRTDHAPQRGIGLRDPRSPLSGEWAEEARGRLIKLRQREISKEYPIPSPANGILRKSMIKEILKVRPTTYEEFLNRVNPSLIKSTANRHLSRDVIWRIVAIIKDYQND